jgi:hypothetical protein
MATSEDLQKQKKALEKLVKLKEQFAEIDFSTSSASAQKLKNNIDKVTESLVKMGMAEERIDAFYKAFVKANASVNDISISLSGNLLKNINKLNENISEGVKQFSTPLEDFKAGAENIIDLLQNTIKKSADLETYALERRRENTRGFVEKSIKLTSDLSKAYDNLIKNEANLGTAKFANLNVEQEIANTLLYINELDKMKLQLAGGYYSSLRMQATTVLEMLNDITTLNKVHRANHDLAKDALETERERLQLEKEIAAEEKKMQQEKEKFDQKQEKMDRELRARELNRVFGPVLAEIAALEKLEEEREKIYEKREKIDRERRARELNRVFGPVLAEIAALEKLEDEIEKFNQKREKIDRDQRARDLNRVFGPLQQKLNAEEKMQEELNKLREKEEEKAKQAYDNFFNKAISKMPLSGILSKTAALGAVAQMLSLIVGGILYLLTKWDFLVSKFAEKLSIARAQAEATLKVAGDLASKFSLINSNMEQVAIAIAEVVEGLGGADITTALISNNRFVERLTQGATVLSDTFGLAGKEIAGMVDASTAMGVSLSSNTIMATAMSKGIMSVNKLMQSLANLSPKILTGFKGSNSQLISMVTKMKLLGVEANNVVSANNKLLDIESSITNAFEAQVATGAQINIDRLMALQMSGKYSDVLDEQLKTLQQSDYLNRSPLAQQLIAEGLGLDAETASQMMLRNLLMERVGLTDELIAKRQQEGKLLENDIRLAEKQGRISKIEADRLMDISKEYDSKTIQEKFIRALNEFTAALSSTLGPLTDILRTLASGINSISQSIGGLTYGLGNVGTGIMSGIAGIGLAASVILLAKKGIGAVRGMAAVLRGGAGGGVGAASTAAGATEAAAQAMTGTGTAKGIGTASKFMKGLKAGGVLGGIATAAEFGVNLSQGQSLGEAAGRAGLSGGLGIAGAALGSLIPLPVVGTLAGGFLGSALGDFIGNQIYGNQMTPEDSAFLESNISAYQNANAASQATATTISSELINAINMMSSKLDTTNSLLSTMNNKQTEIAVELDGERVGKAVMSYSSATMDRNRIIGNNFGANRDQYSNRVPR